MTNQGMDIQHPKARGEWAELRFMTRAAEHGLRVAKPWGDMSPFDFAVEYNGRFLRVQVKCTKYRRGRSYKCHVTANGVPYTRHESDFIAAYVIPADVWYIIPIAATHGQSHVMLSPHRPGSRYDRYKEAWHLLRATAETCPWHDECHPE
ncbi:MAG: hypothetical protein LAO09_13840 [Acidobacteriia bacterium]|nr:hypothetical protein [Terriglobia bacterium]